MEVSRSATEEELSKKRPFVKRTPLSWCDIVIEIVVVVRNESAEVRGVYQICARYRNRFRAERLVGCRCDIHLISNLKRENSRNHVARSRFEVGHS